jgi:predicted transcriptional regulator
MWDDKHSNEFSRRERQVIEIVMRHGRVSAREIEEELPDAPTYSAVRSILRLLVERGLLNKVTGGRARLVLAAGLAEEGPGERLCSRAW